MVDAGETSGTLDMTMQRLSDYYANSNKLNNKVKSAMTYPIILGVLCIVMVIGMFTFIMPIFAGLMPEDQMPALSKALFSFSDFFKAMVYHSYRGRCFDIRLDIRLESTVSQT